MFLTFHVWLRLTTTIKPTWWWFGISVTDKIDVETHRI